MLHKLKNVVWWPCYMKNLKNCQILSEEEEQKILTEYFKTKNTLLGNRLLESNYRLIVQTALKFQGYGFPIEDLIQEGCLGFSVALKKFDMSKNVKLSTYALYWMKAYIMTYIYKNYSICKCNMSSSARKLFFQIRKLKKQMIDKNPQADLSEEDFIEHVSQSFNIGKDKVETVYRFLNETRTTEILFPSIQSTNESQEDIVIRKNQADRLKKILFRTKFSSAGKKAFYDKLFNGSELSYQDLNKKYGIGRTAINQFVEKAQAQIE